MKNRLEARGIELSHLLASRIESVRASQPKNVAPHFLKTVKVRPLEESRTTLYGMLLLVNCEIT